MSSKEELYKLLLENSPYGTLFFAYGICIDSNPKAREILGCDKRTLQGISLDETGLSEPIAVAALKQEIISSLDEGRGETAWRLVDGDKRETINLNVRRLGENGSELLVTLAPVCLSSGADVSVEPNSDTTGSAPESGRTTPSENSPGAFAPGSPDIAGSPKFEPRPDGQIPDESPDESPEEQSPASRQTSKTGDPGRIIDKLGGYVGMRRYDADLDRDVYFDHLTGLPSRQLLIETIRQHQEETASGQICAALMLIDLDHFKDINDSWGHDVGDQVLFKVARAIEPMIDETAMVARMSGDEFMLFFPRAGANSEQGAANAMSTANSIKEAIAQPIFYDGNEFILTASVGIALLVDHETSAERALQYADTAMYEAKRKGRNGVAFFNQSIADKAQRQIGLNTRLRKAVDNQEFALYIQPQVNVFDGRLMGGEVLLRWVNADRVTNMPSEFIPLLESSGLIVDVGHWVIRTACEYIRNFIDEGIWEDHMRLGINISPRQFNDPQLIDVIEHSLRSYEVDPTYLNFEVTENLMIEDVESVIRKMADIKALGAQFSIDDFGIGYSSMIYLKRLPFDWLKIDREFIHNIHNDPESRGVVEAILAVSRQYGLHVTAEGVEDQQSLDVLKKVGCDTYQGAHFSMPVCVDRFREYLAA